MNSDTALRRLLRILALVPVLVLTVVGLALPAGAEVPTGSTGGDTTGGDAPTGAIRVHQLGPHGETVLGGCWEARQAGARVSVGCDHLDGQKDGTVVVGSLPAGTFDLVQGQPPDGYRAGPPTQVTLGVGEQTDVTADLEPLPTFTIRTTGSDGQPLPGSCWLVRPADQTEGGLDLCDTKGAGDAGDGDGNPDGDTVYRTLRPGDYTLVHESAPDGYDRVDDRTVTVTDSPQVLTVPLGRAAAPTNTRLPAIQGGAAVGATVTGDLGDWTNADRLESQWMRCDAGTCSPIPGATGATRQVTASDAGHQLEFAVTASNAAGSTTATSAPAAVPVVQLTPYIDTRPTLSGTPTVGETLAAGPGHWISHSGTLSFAYTWLRCTDACTTVASGGDSYRVVAADMGSRLQVQVTATNDVGSGTALSNQTAVVPDLRPLASTPPTISGPVRLGATLVGSPGTWSSPDGSPISYSYLWQRCDPARGGCTVIGDRFDNPITSSTYTIGSLEDHASVRLAVTATTVRGSTVALSAPTDVLTLHPPVNIGTPRILGAVRVGSTLTADPGTYNPAATHYGYSWYRCDAAAEHCTRVGDPVKSYRIVAADLGHTLRLEVDASNADGTAYVNAAPTAVVRRLPPVNISRPRILGTLRVGSTLTADPGTYNPAATSFEFAFVRCNAALQSCDLVNHKNSRTYTVGAADVGSRLVVRVIARNSDGEVWSYSTPTDVVRRMPPVNVGLPRLLGTARVGSTLTIDPGIYNPAATHYEYGLFRCGSVRQGCTRIDHDRSAKTYRLAPADRGYTIFVEVLAANGDGHVWADSASTDVVR